MEERCNKIFCKQTDLIFGEGNVQVSGSPEDCHIMIVCPNELLHELKFSPLASNRQGLHLMATTPQGKEYLKHMLKVAYNELVKLDKNKDYYIATGEPAEINEEV